jgi:fructokinase
VIVVAGENVVDLIPQPDGDLRPALGGGPANIAVAAARLGAPVAMAARLGGDPFGAGFRARLESAGVSGGHLVPTTDPSTLALATLDAHGAARFDFWLRGAADFGWRDAELPALSAGDVAHLGSLAAFLPPGADALERWAERCRPQCTVSLDPNLRPVVMADRPTATDRLERLVRLAHVVKVSDDDLRLAYPERQPETVARQWARSARLVVLTRGGQGMTAFAGDTECAAPAANVSIVDTIGAGDAAMGALLASVHAKGIDALLADLPGTVRRLCAAAALACTRPGADAPTAAELAAFLDD